MAGSKILLSTSSVYPESVSSCFELAAKLGYDGVELMVGIDPIAADVEAVAQLSEYHEFPVHAVHAPCLLVTQRAWGSDPWDKLKRSAEAAHRFGADVVVVHPPFRWQRDYAANFVAGIAELEAELDMIFAVENMYPWRPSGISIPAYLPDWDPTGYDYAHLTLDLSHASTARKQSLDYVAAWGDRLTHLHLTDGSGSMADEHLLPGQGDQRADEVLLTLANRGFTGHVVLEINTRKAGSRAKREAMLASALAFTRKYLGQPVGAVAGW